MTARTGVSPHFTQMSERAVELMGDGKWHDYETIIRELAKLVPPGVALRRSEQLRQSARPSTDGAAHDPNWKPPPARIRPRSTEDQISTGARVIARLFLGAVGFETNRPGVSGIKVAGQPVRKIRMVRPPRRAGGDWMRRERDQARADLMELQERCVKIAELLTSLGYTAEAEELTRPPSK